VAVNGGEPGAADGREPGVIDARVRLPRELRPPDASRQARYLARYEEILYTPRDAGKTLPDLFADMKDARITGAVLHAEHEYGDVAEALNDTVAELVAEHAELIAGVGTVSMADTPLMERVRQAETVARQGLAGLNIQPGLFGLPIDARELYPLYAKAAEHDLIMFVHTGVNYATHRPIRNEHPLQLDQVACDFPGLRLVACHAGWPFVTEITAVARRHSQVYVDFGGLAPKYVGRPGTGWDPLFGMMDNLLAGQVLFASDWPVFPMPRAVAEWEALNLRPSTLDGLFRENILALLDDGRRGS
jgi:uncharacterized protein